MAMACVIMASARSCCSLARVEGNSALFQAKRNSCRMRRSDESRPNEFGGWHEKRAQARWYSDKHGDFNLLLAGLVVSAQEFIPGRIGRGF